MIAPTTQAAFELLLNCRAATKRYGDAMAKQRIMLEKQRQEISEINDPEERVAQWENLFEAETEALGKLHPTVLETRHSIGFEYYRAKRYAKAENLWEVSLAEFTEVHGPEDEGALRCMNNLAKARFLRGKTTESEPLYRNAIEIADRTLPEDHVLRRRLHENLDMLLEAKSKTHDEPSHDLGMKPGG